MSLSCNLILAPESLGNNWERLRLLSLDAGLWLGCAPRLCWGDQSAKRQSLSDQKSRHLSLCCLCPCLCRHNKLGMKPFFALLLVAGIPGRNWIERTQCRSRTFCLFVFWPDTAGNRHIVFAYWRKKSWLSNKGKGRRRAKGGKAKSGIKRRWQAGGLLRQVLPHPRTPPPCICLACLHTFSSLHNGKKILLIHKKKNKLIHKRLKIYLRYLLPKFLMRKTAERWTKWSFKHLKPNPGV